MTEPTDGFAEPGRDIVAAVVLATLEPTDEFRARLRAELATGLGDDEIVQLHEHESPARRRWPAAIAAAIVAALIAGLVIVTTRADGTDLDPAIDPAIVEEIGTQLDANALTGDELFAALAGRRWLALERFDVANPSAYVPTVAFIGGFIDAHDGCRHYGGDVDLDGAALITNGFEIDDDTGTCDVDDTLALQDGMLIELEAGGDSFVLRTGDETAIARFADQSRLGRPTTEMLNVAWLGDVLSVMEFTDTGRAAVGCTLLRWTVENYVRLMLEDRQAACSVIGDDPSSTASELERAVAQVAADGATIHMRGELPHDGIVITGESRALQLRTLPPVEVDASRITVAAGALFGVEPGVGVDTAELIEAAEPVLGAPGADTGWVDIDSDFLDENEFRELRWGDVVAMFVRRGERTRFWAWYVGDERVIALAIPSVERTQPGDATGLETEHGLAIGDRLADVPDEFNLTIVDWTTTQFSDTEHVELVIVRSPNPAATPGGIVPATRGGTYLAIEGTIVAIGGTDGF